MMAGFLSKNQSGLTLLEVLAVLVIIGIISFVIISRSGSNQSTLFAQAEVIKSHLRYAQSRSMSTNRIYGIEITASASSYAMFTDSNPANRKTLPGEENSTVDLGQYGLSLTPATIYFNDRGTPIDDSGAALETITLMLQNAESESTTIIITRNTGFIP